MLNDNEKEILRIELLQEDREKLQDFRSKVLTALFTICVTLFLILVCCIFNFSRLEKKYNDDCIAGAYYENINEISSYSVTDLTGTIWTINSNINATAGYGEFSVNFIINYDETYSEFNIGYGLSQNPTPPPPVIYGPLVGYVSTSFYNIFASYNEWIADNPVLFLGGIDVTNSNLISWLQANATQIQNSVTLDTPTIILRVLSDDLYPSILIPYDSNVSSYVLKVNTTEYSIALSTLSTTTYNNSTYYTLYLSNNQNYIGALSVKAIGDGSSYLDSDFSNVVNTYSISKNGDFYIQDYWCFNTQTLNILDYYVECSTIQSGTWNNKCFSSIQTNTNIESITMVNCVLKYENVSSNIEISLNTENGVLLDNTSYYLDYSAYISQSYRFENGSTILNKNFTSNEKNYNNIVLTQSNYFIYNGSNNDDNYSMVVISNLTGQYMPTNSYNYLLISFANNQSQYLYANDNFFKLFRIATQEDYAVISAENDRLIQFNQSFTLINLFGAVVDTQISALRGMLNFTMFGVNFYNFFVFILAMALLYFVIKFVRGNFSKKE